MSSPEPIAIASPAETYRGQKQTVLILAASLCIVLGAATPLFPPGSTAEQFFNLAGILGFGLLTFGWVYYDALGRQHPLGTGFRIVLVLFGWAAVFVYLFRSRGFRRGAIASLKAIIVFSGLLLIMILVFAITALIAAPQALR